MGYTGLRFTSEKLFASFDGVSHTIRGNIKGQINIAHSSFWWKTQHQLTSISGTVFNSALVYIQFTMYIYGTSINTKKYLTNFYNAKCPN